MRWLGPIAVSGSVLTGVLALGGVGLMTAAPTTSTVTWGVLGGAAACLCASLGALIARRVPANVVGPLLVAVGVLLAYTATKQIGWVVLARHPHQLRALGWLVAVLAESSVWLLVALALLLLYFPDGQLPGRSWRAVPPALVAAALVHHAYGAVDPAPYNPPLQRLPHRFGPPPTVFEVLDLLAELTLLALLIACAASIVARYRRSDDVRRRQVRWLALAGIGVPGFVLVCGGEVLITGRAGWAGATVGVAAMFAIPVAVAIALLRHDLYDVDRALATTVAWALLTVIVLAVFLVASLVAGIVLGRDSTAAAAAAAALTAVALSPLRRRLQRAVDRRLYPLRQAAFAAIDDLQRGIHVGAARPEQLAERLQVALHDPWLRVGYLIPGGSTLMDESGAPVETARTVVVAAGGTPIGALLPVATAASPELLREVAAASVTLVELVRLRLELTAALREVEASRARLVQVGDDERRRLERDLHDGAQQRLVSLGMALRLAQRRLDGDAITTSDLIDQAVAELGTAVAELRQIAHGLRPSSLDDGLHAALVALTQYVPIPVELQIQTEPLPDDVTMTVYYVASEAIANAVKHADATRIDVCIARRDGQVEVRISDDGRGGATPAAGSGLAGLSDRVHAARR